MREARWRKERARGRRGLETVFEEYALFTGSPGDIVGKNSDLGGVTVWDGRKEVEEGADWEEMG